MRVLHVVDSLERGGQETFLVDLAITQKAMGHTVGIFCISSEGVLAKKAKDNGIDVLSLSGNDNATENTLSALKRLRREINQYQPDAIHTHNRRPLFFTLIASFSRCRKVVNTRHGRAVGGLYWTLGAIFARRIINVSDDLFKQSSGFNRSFLRAKNRVIKNGIQIHSEVSQGLNVGSIIMVGRLNAVKNHLFALTVVRKCLDQGCAISLQIVGDGPELQAIEQQIERLNLQQHVTLLGDRNDVDKLLVNADLFILPSLTEGHSIALLEACAAGLPAIVSNVGGNGEIVQHSKTGFVIDLEDADGFASAITTLINDRQQWSEMSKSTRHWVEDNASMQHCAEQYSDAYS
ncbi:MAG: hypothetical protein COB04_13260 [Gammaproteobacteria bacterium]|nr:MAG: hypothetical protein COB04_13260 [Gammaproteobacteria bacterium]